VSAAKSQGKCQGISHCRVVSQWSVVSRISRVTPLPKTSLFSSSFLYHTGLQQMWTLVLFFAMNESHNKMGIIMPGDCDG